MLVPCVYPLRSLFRLIGREHLRNRYAFPSVYGLWGEVYGFRPDVVIFKKSRLPNLIAGVMAALLGSRRLLLKNRPPETGSWPRRFLIFIGILPSVYITTSARRPGALGLGTVNGALYRPYPIELPALSRTRRAHGSPLRLLMVGSYGNARKRLSWLLEASIKAGLDPRTTTLTIVGTGSNTGQLAQHMDALAREAGWGGSFNLLFNIPQNQMSSIYCDHDVFIMTAKDEPFGMVVMEAMAHGLAVVSNDTVGASDCITHEVNGLIYKSSDLDDLVVQVKRLADSPELLEQLGVAAKTTIATQCTPEAFAEMIENHLDAPG